MPNAHLAQLRALLAEVSDLQAATAVLTWDQATYMPPGGGTGRARQLALLGRLAHEAFTAPAIGRLLDRLEAAAPDLDPDGDEARLIAVTRYEYERAAMVPPKFLAELEQHASEGYQLWAAARPADDFGAVAEHLERTIDLSRRYSLYFGEHGHVADPLIEGRDRGMTVAQLRPLLAELRRQLLPLVEAIGTQPEPEVGMLHRRYGDAEQLEFGEMVIRAFGFDMERGRQDVSHHPFACSFGIGDVRITTRVKRHDLTEALFSTLHEAGHGLYEQGIAPELAGTPLAEGASSGVHESQARLWENVVGRSRAFWEHFFPPLQRAFPAQLGSVSAERFHKAVNRVVPSLIRTDADEVTYNLHVIIRFDLECRLLEGSLPVRELPDAWRERYHHDLSVRGGDDRDGVLQDVHWYGGLVGGAFQGYALGNILSAQFYEAAVRARPTIPAEVACGRFEGLHGWLRENVYRHGSKFPPAELVERATGSPMSLEPYLGYLKRKYSELYLLP